jgi:hypothetical protein
VGESNNNSNNSNNNNNNNLSEHFRLDDDNNNDDLEIIGYRGHVCEKCLVISVDAIFCHNDGESGKLKLHTHVILKY